jgi:hypothetical protein
MLHAAAPFVSWTSLIMLYRYTAYSSIVARWKPLRVRRACRAATTFSCPCTPKCSSCARRRRRDGSRAAASCGRPAATDEGGFAARGLSRRRADCILNSGPLPPFLIILTPISRQARARRPSPP